MLRIFTHLPMRLCAAVLRIELRRGCAWLCMLGLLSACAAQNRPQEGDFALIAVTVAPGCEAPSAVVRELRDARSKAVSARTTPIRVPAGVYTIGISCGTVIDDSGACIDTAATAARSDIPAYELDLRPKTSYVFSCALIKQQNVVKLSQTPL